MAQTICIRNADWVVAWNATTESHEYLQGADVAFTGNEVVHVGKDYNGAVDEEVSGKGLLVMPGLINIHNHTSSMPVFKGLREELGNPRFYMSALYDGWSLFNLEPEDRVWCARFAHCEMLKSGVTTFVDMCRPFPGWLDAVVASGLRTFMAPLFESALWHTENGYQLEYNWYDDNGKQSFDDAIAVIDAAEGHESGRLSGLMAPMAVDTCTPDLMCDSLAVAAERDLPYQLHAGESMMEFLEMTRRTGKTQIQWISELGLLGPRTIIGHGIFLDHHSWLHWATRDDIGLLAESGTSIAHCPTPFSRYGVTLENLGAYLDAGINMGIGTDCSPHNMLEEMRTAAIMARVAAENMFAVRTTQVFEAATVGGAKALGRDDIGCLAPGMKADVVLVDLNEPSMQPGYDPLRCLIYTAADRAVRDVYVDGVKVLENGEVLTLDHDSIAGKLSELQRGVLGKVPERHHAGYTVDELAPLTLPLG